MHSKRYRTLRQWMIQLKVAPDLSDNNKAGSEQYLEHYSDSDYRNHAHAGTLNLLFVTRTDTGDSV